MDTGSRILVIDLRKVEKALRSYGVGMLMTPAEEQCALEKGLTRGQWKLRELYRVIFEERLREYTEIQSFKGKKVSLGGMRFMQRVNSYPQIAEEAFRTWSQLLGLFSMYQESKKEKYEIDSVEDTSLKSVYQRLSDLIHAINA